MNGQQNIKKNKKNSEVALHFSADSLPGLNNAK